MLFCAVMNCVVLWCAVTKPLSFATGAECEDDQERPSLAAAQEVRSELERARMKQVG